MYKTGFYLKLFNEYPLDFTTILAALSEDNILIKIILVSFWFYIGVLLRKIVLPRFPKIKHFLKLKNVLQLILIFFSIMFSIKLTIGIISDSIIKELLDNICVNNVEIQNMEENKTDCNQNLSSTASLSTSILLKVKAAATGAIITPILIVF